MQEELTFLHHPELEYEKLSASSEYFLLLNEFNEKYGIDLDYTPKARWKPGTYDKIKNKMRDIEYPHWSNKRGANNLRKLFEVQSWNRRGFVDGLHKLDDMMANYRYNSINLVDGDLVEQGKALIDEVYNTLSRPVNDVSIRVLPFPLFNRNWYHDSNEHVHIPYCPTLNPISLDIDTGIHGENLNSSIFQSDQDIWKDKNPNNWFVNIIVKLPNVSLRCYKDANIGEKPENCILTHPYGDLVIGLTISLFDYCMGRRAALGAGKISKWIKNLTTYVYQMPIIEGVRHPFVYKMTLDNTSISYNSRTYGHGNVCFGDWSNDIFKQLMFGNLGIMRALLRSWSEIYYVHNTGPLNTLYQSFIGNSKSWSENTRAAIGASSATCETVMRHGMEKETLLDNHCADCTLAADLSCRLYRKLTKKLREIPGEFAEWALEKAQPSITLAGGLKTIYTKLYNMQMDSSPELVIQRAFFTSNMPGVIKGHMSNEWFDDHFNDEFRSMQVDGYAFREEHLNMIYAVAERMFYIYRIHEIYAETGIMEAVYTQYCVDTETYVNLDAANKKYSLADMKSSLNMMMMQIGTAVVDSSGHFALTKDNDFNQHIKYIGGLNEW